MVSFSDGTIKQFSINGLEINLMNERIGKIIFLSF